MNPSGRRRRRRNIAGPVPSPTAPPPAPPPNHSLPPPYRAASDQLSVAPEVLLPCTGGQESGLLLATEPHSGVTPEPENSVSAECGDEGDDADQEEAPQLGDLVAVLSRLRETITEPCLMKDDYNRGAQDEAEERASGAQCMSVNDDKLILSTEAILWQVKKIWYIQLEMLLRVSQEDVRSQTRDTYKAFQESYRALSNLLPEKLPAPGRPWTPRAEELEETYMDLHLSYLKVEAQDEALKILSSTPELKHHHGKERPHRQSIEQVLSLWEESEEIR